MVVMVVMIKMMMMTMMIMVMMMMMMIIIIVIRNTIKYFYIYNYEIIEKLYEHNSIKYHLIIRIVLHLKYA